MVIFTWLPELNFIVLQGAKVLEDREIRHGFYWATNGAPPRHVSPEILKYTGTSAAPEWKDEEQGRTLNSPWYFVRSAQNQTDKFETLCYVDADISTAPCTSKHTAAGKTAYQRDCDVILLVGLTELKAQVSWIDSETVRPHVILHVSIYLTQFPRT